MAYIYRLVQGELISVGTIFGTIFAQEKDSNLSSKIDVFCNKYRFLMVEV